MNELEEITIEYTDKARRAQSELAALTARTTELESNQRIALTGLQAARLTIAEQAGQIAALVDVLNAAICHIERMNETATDAALAADDAERADIDFGALADKAVELLKEMEIK
jgi:hypothetical protein